MAKYRSRRGVTPIVHEERDITSSLLTEAEMRDIEAECLADVEAEARAAAKAAYKKDVKLQHRRAKGLEEPQETVLIDVAGHADSITLDGQKFFHNHVYTVPLSVARTLYDVMGNTWRHEEEIGNANSNAYRKPMEARLNMQTGAVSRAAGSVVNTSVSFMSQGRIGPKVTLPA